MTVDSQRSREALAREVEELRAEVTALRAAQAGAERAQSMGSGVHSAAALIGQAQSAIYGMPPATYDAHAHARRVRQARKVEASLQASEERFQAIFEQAAVGLALLSLDGRWEQVNQRLCDIVGYQREELLTLPFQAITPEGDLKIDLAHAQRLLDGTISTYQTEKRYIRRDGSPIWVNLTLSLIRSKARRSRGHGAETTLGTPTHFIAVIEDISPRKTMERQKDEFLSVVSHEMKTPLTTLKMLSQLTRRRLERSGALDTQQTRRMESSIARMERLINDLLDSGRIESGQLTLRFEPCDLVELCRNAAEEQGELNERAIRLALPRAPLIAEVDAERIGQALTNLLANAIKFSSQNRSVWLTLRRNRDLAVISVRDEGAGIPPDALPHLFERFYRVPGAQTQTGSSVGLGLGLYISHEIATRHGGRLEVASAIGAGSVFRLQVPLHQQRASAHERDGARETLR